VTVVIVTQLTAVIATQLIAVITVQLGNILQEYRSYSNYDTVIASEP